MSASQHLIQQTKENIETVRSSVADMQNMLSDIPINAEIDTETEEQLVSLHEVTRKLLDSLKLDAMILSIIHVIIKNHGKE